jgi:hypothetical protein
MLQAFRGRGKALRAQEGLLSGTNLSRDPVQWKEGKSEAPGVLAHDRRF